MMYRAKEATARYMKWDISEEENVSLFRSSTLKGWSKM